MIIIKKVDQYLNVIVSTILNIEHGIKRFEVHEDKIVDRLQFDSMVSLEPMLTIELPKTYEYSTPIKIKVNSRYGFIFCLLDSMSIEQFAKQIKNKLNEFSSDHLINNITGVSHSTLTTQDLPSPYRKFIISDHVFHNTMVSGFTWYISGLSGQIFSPHIYSKMKQVVPMLSSILFDEIDIFSYNHNEIIKKTSASKMKIPRLPDSLQGIYESLKDDQVGILINHDLYEVEFISQFSAIMCTGLSRNNLRIPTQRGPSSIPKWSTVKKTLTFQTSCEYDCFICRFPICTNGYVVKALNVLDDHLDDNVAEIYCTYIDPILSHFIDSEKHILVCSHCIRIITYLSKLNIELNAYHVRIPISYSQLVTKSPKTKNFANILSSIEIGKESKVLKGIYGDKHFYIIDHKDINEVLIKNQRVRKSQLPLLPVTMFWFNSEVGYR